MSSTTDAELIKTEENELPIIEDRARSPGECIDSPDPIPEDTGDENIEDDNLKSKQYTSAMEGELDFEEGWSEHKKGEKGSDGEEGQISESTTKKREAGEEGEDDGEISDEDELEEGEVKDNSPAAKQPARQVCRFFNRGQCTWGTQCRFLHLSVNDRGHYNMFAPTPPRPGYGPPGNGMINQRSGQRGPDFMTTIPPPLPPPDMPPVETAWERGLRHAKELMKKANKRKEQDADFEEKRLNLGIDENIRSPSEYDKENEAHEKLSYRRQNDVPAYKYEDGDMFDNGEREAREHWKGGRYENFEIRWTRQEMHGKERREKRSRGNRERISPSDREKMPKRGKSQERWRDDRLFEMQSTSRRADEWRDPWRRSKSPKGRRSASGGRSRGSYSSVSSYTYSDRSSRSSYSYSRSSSRSSFYSSRSPSPSRLAQKRKLSPDKELTGGVPPKRPNTVPEAKRKGHRSSSSRSRSRSRTPSVSRSRSRTYSRSLSMDSVSSASSSISHSSSGSVSRKQNQHMSILRKEEEIPLPLKPDPKPGTSSLFEEMQRLKQPEQIPKGEEEKILPPKVPLTPIVPKPAEKPVEELPYTSLRNLLPASEKVLKDPVKYHQHKQQIKLTLLNRALMAKSAILPPPKRDIDLHKLVPPDLKVSEEIIKSLPTFPVGVGICSSPASPPPQAMAKPAPPSASAASAAAAAAASKRSTSSRRDELLKQLKAVEDAIARKRAKFS